MKVGDKFLSYDEFECALADYKTKTNNEYWLRDSRTIENQKHRNPNTVANINLALKYYYIRLACVRGGRPFKSKNESSNRKCSTYKQQCPATIFLKVSSCKQFLIIQETKDDHNHTSSKAYFNSLAKQRLNLPENIKLKAQKVLKAGANKKKVLNQIIKETGCRITLKDLTNLSNRSKSERKKIEECVHILKNNHNCTEIEILVDKNKNFQCLYFQDDRMKNYMNAYPEIIFIDGTYCLVDSHLATYIIMIEDGNGLSEIVAICLVAEESEESLNFFVDTFKNRNPAWEKVEVVMSDKDRTERSVFSKSFPNAKLMMCLFHAFQIFHREVSTKKMGIGSDEVQVSKQYLQKLAYALSEANYNEIYNEMVANVPKCVKINYDSNWGNITDQWVQYLTLQNQCMANKSNNRLESINAKLKSVITRYSPLEDFIEHLFIIINSLRTGKDVKNVQMLNRILTRPFKETSAEYFYYRHLTEFAFEKVEGQLNRVNSCKNMKELSNATFLAESSEGLLQVTPFNCECLFRKSTGLPCRHIFKCRSLMSLSLLDVNLCLTIWSRSYCEKILNDCEATLPFSSEHDVANQCDDSSIVANVLQEQAINLKPRYLRNHKKFNIMQEEGRKLAQLCSEVSTDIFYKRLKIVQTIAMNWADHQDSVIINLFSNLTNNNGCEIEAGSAQTTENSNLRIDIINLSVEQNEDVTEEFLHSNSQIADSQIEIKNVTQNKEITEEFLVGTDGELISISDFTDEITREPVLEPEQNCHDKQYEIEITMNLKLQEIKMPTKIRKRGRPKGYGNTVIGLKRSMKNKK